MSRFLFRFAPVWAALLLTLLHLTSPAMATATPIRRDQIITGQVVDSHGRPMPLTTIVITDDRVLLPFDARSKCASIPGAYDPDGICFPPFAEAITNAQGRYRVILTGGSPLARPGLRHVRVVGHAPLGRSYPRFVGSFALTPAVRSFPLLTLWTQPGVARQGNGSTSFTLTPPPRLTALSGTLNDRWGASYDPGFDESGQATVDDRVLESNMRSLEAAGAGSWFGHPAQWSSGSLIVSTYGVPASRGLRCSLLLRDGVTQVDIPSCPFTDGRLSPKLGYDEGMNLVRRLAGCSATGPCGYAGIVVDLGAPRLLGAVVWRNCPDCSLQLSLGPNQWASWPLERRAGGQDAVLTGTPMPVRFLRITSGSFAAVADLREFSVWADPLVPAV